jgi:uncharacterized protein (TIGR03437 family)
MVPCLLIATLLAVTSGSAQTVTTTAGNGSPGFSGENTTATAAQLDTVYGVAVDSHGYIFVADSRNHRIRKIANGVITTVAGNGQEGAGGDNGPATSAQLSFPRDVAVDAQGNLYIADTGNSRIRKVTAAGVISTIAGDGTPGFTGDGNAATSAELSYPAALAMGAGGVLYIADSWNYRIRKITSDGKIQTVAGNGSYGPFGDGGLATAASLGLIQSLAVDAQGNLYLSDSYNHRIRKVTAAGAISSVVGGGFGPAADGGAALSATLKFPKGVAVDSQGNLYVADSLNHRIRKVTSGGVISTVAGSGAAGYSGDGPATTTQLNSPYGLGADPTGPLYFSDLWNYRVRNLGSAAVTPIVTAITDVAGSQPIITSGAYMSIWGSNLAPKTDNWNTSIANQQLPTQLSGVSVTVGGKPAYVHYISAGQINIVAPDVSAGSVQVQVSNSGVLSAPFTATARRYGPAFFLWGQYAVATHTDYTNCAKAGLFTGLTTVPAKPGEWIVLWGNGFGPTDVTVGMLTPADNRTHATATTTVTVGGVNATVYSGAAALASGYAGLYQVAIQIPASTPDGDAIVRATVGGVQSPDNVLITVKR